MGKKQDDRRFEEYSKGRVVCSCGHTMFLPNKVDRLICTWCGCWVYKNEQIKFRYQLEQTMKKKKLVR